MAKFHPNDLIEGMKLESLKVHAPTSIVFLCGGAMQQDLAAPAVLRDAFFRTAKLAGEPYTIVLAEEAKPLTNDAGYSNLLSFESDIAQVVGLILLFVESAGSLAELGAFAALDTVAPSLLAVLDDFYYGQGSFVRDGPVRYLEKEYGDEWVHVLDRADVGIDAEGIAGLKAENFAASILPVVNHRLAAKPKWEKFDAKNSGHAILAIVGICRELGAMTQAEIRATLTCFGVKKIRFDNLVYCGELLGWLRKVRKGNHIFFVAVDGEAALDYHLNDKAPFKEKLRWRSDIREYWKANDRARFNAISELMQKAPDA
jgi:hypothetical protein